MSREKKEKTCELNELIKKVLNGDSESFSLIAEEYKPLLNNLLSSFQNDNDLTEQDIEDLKQEELVALYRAISTYNTTQSEVKFGLYAKICISNSLISYKRAISKESARLSTTGEEDLLNISDKDYSPEEYFALNENKRLLDEKIESSLSSYENSVWLNYVNGESTKTIASRLGENEKSIDNAIFRIKRKLRKLLT